MGLEGGDSDDADSLTEDSVVEQTATASRSRSGLSESQLTMPPNDAQEAAASHAPEGRELDANWRTASVGNAGSSASAGLKAR